MDDPMSYTVYVLYSPKFEKIYIGYTSNLSQRLKSHNHLGKKGWTIKFRPWKVVFTEKYASKKEALRREKQLKSGAGRRFIWETIQQAGGSWYPPRGGRRFPPFGGHANPTPATNNN